MKYDNYHNLTSTPEQPDQNNQNNSSTLTQTDQSTRDRFYEVARSLGEQMAEFGVFFSTSRNPRAFDRMTEEDLQNSYERAKDIRRNAKNKMQEIAREENDYSQGLNINEAVKRSDSEEMNQSMKEYAESIVETALIRNEMEEDPLDLKVDPGDTRKYNIL